MRGRGGHPEYISYRHPKLLVEPEQSQYPSSDYPSWPRKNLASQRRQNLTSDLPGSSLDISPGRRRRHSIPLPRPANKSSPTVPPFSVDTIHNSISKTSFSVKTTNASPRRTCRLGLFTILGRREEKVPNGMREQLKFEVDDMNNKKNSDFWARAIFSLICVHGNVPTEAHS
jgi:hypothetical protein